MNKINDAENDKVFDELTSDKIASWEVSFI